LRWASQAFQLEAAGIEPIADLPRKTAVSSEGGAESGKLIKIWAIGE
jgi:hypothetical protein